MIDPLHIVHEAMDVVDRNRKGRTDKIKALAAVIKGESDNVDLCYAWDKFKQNRTRMIINAYLLADANLDVIRQATHIPMRVLQVYTEYIFDMTVFRDETDRVDYVEKMAMHLSTEEHQFYTAALTAGDEYLSWLLRKGPEKAPKEVLKHFMMDSYFRSLEHRNAPLTSDIAHAALSWMKQGAGIAARLHQLDPQDDKEAMEELRLALGFEDTTINEYTTGAP